MCLYIACHSSQKVADFTSLFLVSPAGDGACKWNGAGWQEDSSGLLNHQESTYTHPRHLHGQANTVSAMDLN